MRILVTGGAGYIGSITTKELLDAGHEVVVLDSLVTGHIEAVDPRAELYIEQIGNEAMLDEVLPGCDAVMHLAGLIEVAESQKQPDRYYDYNVAQPLEMLVAMERHGITKLVCSSTAAVYGEPKNVPITEEAETSPINVYGETKLLFEQLLEVEEVLRGLRSIRFRYFNVAGAAPDGSLGEAHAVETHLIPRALESIRKSGSFEIFGNDFSTPDGTCIRDYIHVCDLAVAHRLALEALDDGHKGGIYNLGNGRGFSNLAVVNACSRVLGNNVKVKFGPKRDGDPAKLVASSKKAREELGWEPKHTDLDDMIADAWRWQSKVAERKWAPPLGAAYEVSMKEYMNILSISHTNKQESSGVYKKTLSEGT